MFALILFTDNNILAHIFFFGNYLTREYIKKNGLSVESPLFHFLKQKGFTLTLIF